jgi:2'-5' RNA ligase
VPWDAPGSTAIVVLTPEADPVTGELYRRYANAGREGMTPHITLLTPFVSARLLDPDANARLRRVLQEFSPFDYTLERFERFPGVLFLAPEPVEPFVKLIVALTSAFPDCPPYDGAHDTIVPHGTVAQSNDPALLDQIASQISPSLPIACRADEATLLERGSDRRWRPRAVLPLGR